MAAGLYDLRAEMRTYKIWREARDGDVGRTLALTTLKYLCIKHGDQKVFSIFHHHKFLI